LGVHEDARCRALKMVMDSVAMKKVMKMQDAVVAATT
jgi:hypothetical protein